MAFKFKSNSCVLSLAAAALFSPTLVFSQSEPIPIKLFSRSAGASGYSANSGKIIDRRERAIQLNKEGIALVFQGQRGEGIAKIKQALAHDPENTSILYNLAGVYLKGDEPRSAIPVMVKALEVEPDDISYLSRLAEAFVAANQINKAIDTYQGIVELDPNFGEAHLKLGTLYGVQKRWSKAESALNKAKETFGEDPRLLSNLGSILIASKKFEEAISVLELAQSKFDCPENAVALGIAFESLGKHQIALKHYRHAKELGENSKDLEMHMMRIEQLVASQ